MRAIELFAGAGGLGMGISQAGFEPVQIVEWNRWCCDTIRENRKAGVSLLSKWPAPLEGDIRQVDFSRFEDKVELVSGGPPCQPFSLGGKHKAYDDERDMWSEAVRVVREVRPQAFVFENVKGLTRSTFATYLAYIVHQLSYPEIQRRKDEDWADHMSRLERHHTAGKVKGLEYNVVYRVLNAADYGVPQKRERVVFVGFRKDMAIEWAFPRETHSLEALLWEQCQTGEYWERHKVAKRHRTEIRLHEKGLGLIVPAKLKPWSTVRDAIGDLPDPEHDVVAAARRHNHRFQPGARSYPGHTGSPMDEPAKTLKAGVHGVPGGENMLCRADGSVRYFTVRESARLQTFPDGYRLHGSWTECMRQLGNAVPVKLAKIVAENVAGYLREAA